MFTTPTNLSLIHIYRKYSLVPMLRRIEACDIDTGHFYVQVTDYLSEVSKALLHITRPAMEHISNNHEGLLSLIHI